jgi:histidine triad (HIT) family protein
MTADRYTKEDLMAECIFCRVGRGEIPAETLFEDEFVMAFRDIHPVAPVHVLVIPKQHVTAAWELDQSHGFMLARMFIAASEVATKTGIDERGYRLVINSGPDAGQSVDHLHMHVLGGKVMGWPPFPPEE